MKKVIVIVAVITAFALLVGCAASVPPNVSFTTAGEGKMTTIRNITVSGDGKVKVKPDTATVNVGVITRAPTAEEASSKNAADVENVIAKVKAIGVKDKDITTGYYSIYPEYNWNSGTQEFIGYQANTSLSIKTKKIDETGEIIDAAIKGTANQSNGVQFSLEEDEEFYKEALAKAFDKAKSSAEAIAAASGMKLGQIYSISDSGSPTVYFGYTGNEMDAVAAPAPEATAAPKTIIRAQDSEVYARITVVYQVG